MFQRRQAAQARLRAGSFEREQPGEVEEQSCPNLAKVLDKLEGKLERRSEILDLGSLCGSTAVYLAERGGRVSVEQFDPPPPADPARDDDEQERPPLVIQQPDAKFDLVLAWEYCDFVAPDRLSEFAAELRRVLLPGGWLILLARDSPRNAAEPDRLRRYRLTAADRLELETSQVAERPRWVHPTREIERALAPLSIQGIHLQRNRTREFVAFKQKD